MYMRPLRYRSPGSPANWMVRTPPCSSKVLRPIMAVKLSSKNIETTCSAGMSLNARGRVCHEAESGRSRS